MPDEDADHGMVPIRNQPPGSRCEFPAAEIVDAGFLELVRYGVRKPGDALIQARGRRCWSPSTIQHALQ
jgi:glucoamylase